MLDRDVLIDVVTQFGASLSDHELRPALLNVLRMRNLEGLVAGTSEAAAAVEGALAEAVDNSVGHGLLAQLSRSGR